MICSRNLTQSNSPSGLVMRLESGYKPTAGKTKGAEPNMSKHDIEILETILTLIVALAGMTIEI